MLDWLSRLFDWAFQFVPQFEIVLPNEEAVRFTCIPFIHEWMRTCKPGWYCYWPLFQNFERLVVKTQTIALELSRENNVGKSTESLWAVVYWVNNIQKALYECEDVEELLISHAARIVGRHINEQPKPWDLDAIVKEVRGSMSGLGIHVQQIFPVQVIQAKAYKLFLENLAERVGRIVG